MFFQERTRKFFDLVIEDIGPIAKEIALWMLSIQLTILHNWQLEMELVEDQGPW
jgi:hypothetical protein